LLFSILFGVLNELIQMTVEARSDELADVAADALGAVIVQAGFLYRHRRRRVSGV
jgi:VanZ family protein